MIVSIYLNSNQLPVALSSHAPLLRDADTPTSLHQVITYDGTLQGNTDLRSTSRPSPTY
jgi:hypothetical protein